MTDNDDPTMLEIFQAAAPDKVMVMQRVAYDDLLQTARRVQHERDELRDVLATLKVAAQRVVTCVGTDDCGHEWWTGECLALLRHELDAAPMEAPVVMPDHEHDWALKGGVPQFCRVCAVLADADNPTMSQVCPVCDQPLEGSHDGDNGVLHSTCADEEARASSTSTAAPTELLPSEVPNSTP